MWREGGSALARRRGQIAVVAAFCAAAAVAAQEPTFRSEISYVQVPVRVLDGAGQFVRGLTQADFQVLEDGKPQTITAFSAVDIPFIPPDATVVDMPVADVDPVASNESTQVDGRVYLFVLDDDHTESSDTLRVRQLVHEFIRERLSANDLAAIVITGGSRAQDFTRNRKLLHDAVDRFIGDHVGGQDPAVPLRAHQLLKTITNMSEWLGTIKGRRKALVLVSPSSICSLDEYCSGELRQTLRTAMQSDVSIYTIDPRGLFATRGSRAENSQFEPAQESPRGEVDGARYLAEESGGFAVIDTNNYNSAFDRIVRENSSYYLIGYYSTNNRADGRFRKNEVKVTRRGMQVVHRGGYVAPRAVEGAKATDAAGTVPTLDEQLRELERNSLPVSAMALRVAAAPFLAAGGQSRVAIVVEMPNDTLKPTEEDGRYLLTVGLSIGLYDRDGKVVGTDDPTIELTLPLSVGPKIVAQGIRIVSRVSVPPGTYRLMVGAAQTPSGVRGSVMTEIDIPDFDRQPLALSGIAVTTSVATRMYTARTDELLDDVLGAPPIAHREFPADSDLWVYGEIYDHRSAAGVVTATVTVKTADGKVVFETPFEPAPVQFGHLARIPLKELGPGSFVATIEARSATPKPVSATRAVAFRVR